MLSFQTTNKRTAHVSAVIIASVVAGFSGHALANDSGTYVSAFIGGKFITDDIEFTNGITIVDTDFDTGYILGGSIGYRWGNQRIGGLVPRTEIEVNYSNNEVDSLDFSGNGPGAEVVAQGSDISTVGIFANLYLDAPDALGRGITPYFGGGLGVNIVRHDIFYNAPNLNLNDTDTAFAWHVTGGLSVDFTDSSEFFVDVGYHQSVDVGSDRRIGGNLVGGGAGPGGGRFEDDKDSVIAKAGLRYGF